MENQLVFSELSECWPLWNWEPDDAAFPIPNLQFYHDYYYTPRQDLLPDDFMVEEEMLRFWREEEVKEQEEEMMRRVVIRKKEDIGFEDLARYFRVPINKAAKELKIGVTLLKQRCRELNIPRWPCRKLKSLDSLIKNVQELAAAGQVEEEQLKETVEMLEEERRKMENQPIMDLEDNTKVLRQACFKANYRRKRLFISMQASN